MLGNDVISKNPYPKKRCNLNMLDGTATFPPTPSLIKEGVKHVDPSNNIRRAAFTLAEVLITLGIIGVVAAMTIPVLIQKHRNQEVEVRLKKFYSSYNQALIMAESEFGDKANWKQTFSNYAEFKIWFDTYLAKYLKYTSIENAGNRGLVVFPDGSGLLYYSSNDYYFIPKDYQNIEENSWGKIYPDKLGRNAFAFMYTPGWDDKEGKGLEPYFWNWNGTKESLYTNCENAGYFCTLLIQYNGWKITKDYPRKISY